MARLFERGGNAFFHGPLSAGRGGPSKERKRGGRLDAASWPPGEEEKEGGGKGSPREKP